MLSSYPRNHTLTVKCVQGAALLKHRIRLNVHVPYITHRECWRRNYHLGSVDHYLSFGNRNLLSQGSNGVLIFIHIKSVLIVCSSPCVVLGAELDCPLYLIVWLLNHIWIQRLSTGMFYQISTLLSK